MRELSEVEEKIIINTILEKWDTIKKYNNSSVRIFKETAKKLIISMTHIPAMQLLDYIEQLDN